MLQLIEIRQILNSIQSNGVRFFFLLTIYFTSRMQIQLFFRLA